MKIRDKNKMLEKLIADLDKSKNPLYRSIAKALNRPRRVRFEVNLHRIERYAKPKETIIVPGIVLGDGEIKKPVTIAALRFSETAKKKIEKAGGQCMEIKDLLDKKPSNIRIMG